MEDSTNGGYVIFVNNAGYLSGYQDYNDPFMYHTGDINDAHHYILEIHGYGNPDNDN